MAKFEDKGETKFEDKGEAKFEDKGLDGLLSGGGGPFGAGGWVVVSFIGPAGLDVRKLAAAVLLGGAGGPRPRTKALGQAAAAALDAVRKREAVQKQLIKAAVQGKKGLPKQLAGKISVKT